MLHDWCYKCRGMYYPVCGMGHIKEPLLLIGISSLCSGSNGFPLSISVWSFTIIMSDVKKKTTQKTNKNKQTNKKTTTKQNTRKINMLNASLNKKIRPFYRWVLYGKISIFIGQKVGIMQKRKKRKNKLKRKNIIIIFFFKYVHKTEFSIKLPLQLR